MCRFSCNLRCDIGEQVIKRRHLRREGIAVAAASTILIPMSFVRINAK